MRKKRRPFIYKINEEYPFVKNIINCLKQH
jgi:hypothetical protein